jgi:lipid A 3-O-deacylase
MGLQEFCPWQPRGGSPVHLRKRLERTIMHASSGSNNTQRLTWIQGKAAAWPQSLDTIVDKRSRLPLALLICVLGLALTARAEPSGTDHDTSGEMVLRTTLTNSTARALTTFDLEQSGIWEKGVGEGFRPSTQSLGLAAGATRGVEVLGGEQSHDLALASLSYGHMIGKVRGEGHWYRGNGEFRLELFGGAEFAPSNGWLIGLTPHLRYHFATGTRWIPFLDVGAGVTAARIGPPDLSGTFEFNLQAGGGVQWFLTDNVALSFETRYLHVSCAGIHKPNLGLNTLAGLLGITFYF